MNLTSLSSTRRSARKIVFVVGAIWDLAETFAVLQESKYVIHLEDDLEDKQDPFLLGFYLAEQTRLESNPISARIKTAANAERKLRSGFLDNDATRHATSQDHSYRLLVPFTKVAAEFQQVLDFIRLSQRFGSTRRSFRKPRGAILIASEAYWIEF